VLLVCVGLDVILVGVETLVGLDVLLVGVEDEVLVVLVGVEVLVVLVGEVVLVFTEGLLVLGLVVLPTVGLDGCPIGVLDEVVLGEVLTGLVVVVVLGEVLTGLVVVGRVVPAVLEVLPVLGLVVVVLGEVLAPWGEDTVPVLPAVVLGEVLCVLTPLGLDTALVVDTWPLLALAVAELTLGVPLEGALPILPAVAVPAVAALDGLLEAVLKEAPSDCVPVYTPEFEETCPEPVLEEDLLLSPYVDDTADPVLLLPLCP